MIASSAGGAVDRAIHSATSRLKIGIPKIISIRLNGSIEQPPAAARAHKRIADQSRWIAARHVGVTTSETGSRLTHFGAKGLAEPMRIAEFTDGISAAPT